MEGRRKKRLLSKEEIELWARVTRNDEPLARPQPDTPAPHEGVGAAPAPQLTTRAKPLDTAPMRAEPTVASPGAVPAAMRPTPPPHQPFDHRIVRKIARGRREIDARIDLHGLRQHDAYATLRAFLARCQVEGHRHVLIITGKGGRADSDSRDFWTTENRGVLRRLVPHWLSEPDFRVHVVSFTESAHHHGGSGALYVTIRRRSKPG
ncbi:Smr/MutS family protein [Rhodomicrobium vannielii ATCC 17100]|uniref:Smr/MutS family protein n=1 Tax=Rhodomicrobium vannielii TaxID=1069 RepID=UPI00191B0002|nr:Smr/MutS family protein [Rhodomicrobium vannielii]MBJ7533063.1 Smr/MutS family protein [Rhodomicrobium vannielii ATCC 17100]